MGGNKHDAENEDNTITTKDTQLDGSAMRKWWPWEPILFPQRRNAPKQVKKKALPLASGELGKQAKKLRLLTFTDAVWRATTNTTT